MKIASKHLIDAIRSEQFYNFYSAKSAQFDCADFWFLG